MKKARKKPVEINYLTFDTLVNYHEDNLVATIEVDKILNQLEFKKVMGSEDTYHILIATLEGVMTMKKQDVLIVGVQGEVYPCKWDIFLQTYDILEGE